jgi:hypothetical protein
MFDMKENAGDSVGYELRITYDAKYKRYSVSGYIIFDGPEYARDGSFLHFQTMEEAIKYITDSNKEIKDADNR